MLYLILMSKRKVNAKKEYKQSSIQYYSTKKSRYLVKLSALKLLVHLCSNSNIFKLCLISRGM